MSRYIKKKLIEIVDNNSTNSQPGKNNNNDLFQYLDDSLGTLSDDLYTELFRKLLQGLWASVVQVFSTLEKK